MTILLPTLATVGIASIIASLFFATPYLTREVSTSTHQKRHFKTAIILASIGLIITIPSIIILLRPIA